MGKILIPRLSWLLLTCLMLSQSPLLAADATITVTKEQGGREIALKVGNILLIELPGKGGTGYSWLVEAAGAPYLKLMDHTTRQLKEGRLGGPDRLGGPVMQVWRFKATQPGACEIKIAYYRPWEGVGKAVDHFRLKLHIE
ncbi:MAG: protease inhibitor I42 family protein [Proteobacteria bacterium]|nr:protease inhibitor I42 family protein [Pseudomonadota bacterium]MBU4355415.1 protease inhibitor I42 family protein [Pseudomonadota bacterium]MBU4447286.1 protease inhibitor I42 family protein [Pseudomonadota bacterium]MCG2772928.1 protease inhibitor I42 family protein [Desulfobacterales bacterium]